MAKTYHIHDEMFHAHVVFYVGKSPEDKALAACVYDRECTGVNAGIKEYVIELKDPSNFYGIVHEVVHLVQHIFTDRDILFNEANHEVMAYYQEWWVRKLWHLASRNLDKPNG